MAPPKKKLDENLIRNLAAIHCTTKEIAVALGVSEDTLERRYAALIKEGREHGKTSLRRHMWKAATEKGNVTMLIWLSKNLLGFTDKIETTNETTTNVKAEVEYSTSWGSNAEAAAAQDDQDKEKS